MHNTLKILYQLTKINYRIARNFHGVQFSRMASLQSFCGLIFADAHHHAHYTLYNRTYFTGLIFADSRLSAKTVKIGPLENFPLYATSGTNLFSMPVVYRPHPLHGHVLMRLRMLKLSVGMGRQVKKQL